MYSPQLTDKQLEILQWVADECPSTARTASYKAQASQLRVMKLVKVKYQPWRAELTAEGIRVLGLGPAPKAPAVRPHEPPRAPKARLPKPPEAATPRTRKPSAALTRQPPQATKADLRQENESRLLADCLEHPHRIVSRKVRSAQRRGVAVDRKWLVIHILATRLEERGYAISGSEEQITATAPDQIKVTVRVDNQTDRVPDLDRKGVQRTYYGKPLFKKVPNERVTISSGGKYLERSLTRTQLLNR